MPSLGPGLISRKLREKSRAVHGRAMVLRFYWLRSGFLVETSGYPVTLSSQEEEKLLHPVSKTWSEMGSDIFWSSRCSIELDEIRKSFIFRQPHFPDGSEQPQNTWSVCSTCRKSDVRFSLNGAAKQNNRDGRLCSKSCSSIGSFPPWAGLGGCFRLWRVLHRLLLIV